MSPKGRTLNLFSLFLGLKRKKQTAQGKKPKSRRIKKPRRFLVVGLGRFGYSVAKTLAESDMEVIAVDKSMQVVEKIKDIVPHSYKLNALDERALRTIGAQDVDVAIVAIGTDIQSSILTTLILKEMGIPVIIAKAIDELHGKVLEKIGVSRVVYPEVEMGVRVARALVSPIVIERMELGDYSLAEITPPKDIVGKTLGESRFRNRYGANVIAVRKRFPEVDEKGEVTYVEEIDASPGPETVINKDDVLIVFGPNESLEKLQKRSV